MNKAAVIIAVVLLIVGGLLMFSPALGRLTTTCTGPPYLSGVFTGQVTDAATGLGIQSASMAWFDPANSNTNAGGTFSGSGGYYYVFSAGPVGQHFNGCDNIGLTIGKAGYDPFTTTFQLPDNAGCVGTTPCGSFTYGANYALHQGGTHPLTASFTWVASSLTVSFTDRSIGIPTSWSWNFGDTHTSTSQNPTYTYALGGTYDVQLTVTRSSDGVQSTVTSVVTVAYAGTGQGQTGQQQCPAGYTGTYPNCAPPPYNPSQNPSQPPSNTTSNYTAPPAGFTTLQWVGVGFFVVGFVMVVAGGMLPGIIFTAPYVHPEDVRRQRR